MMSLGARGVISVWANVMPAEVHEMCQAFIDGDTDRALYTQLKCLKFINSLFCEVNPIPVKAALEMMGFGEAVYRQPLGPISEAGRTQVAEAMRELGLILK